MQIDPTECAYRLAAAMYAIAEREARGDMGHWSSQLSNDEMWRKQQEAHAFCQEWRGHFAERQRIDIDPLPEPTPRPQKPKAKGGRRPKGTPSVMSQAADWLAAHGPATAREIADAIGCGYANATHMLRAQPGLFYIADERRNEPVVATLWNVRKSRRGLPVNEPGNSKQPHA